MRLATGFLLFAIAWLGWSGHYTPLLLGFGAVSSALVALLAWRTGFFASDVYTLHLGRRLVSLWLWLFVEILRANLMVARIVLARRLRYTPQIISVNASDLPPPCQVILANAITLTPGTAALDINEGRIRVHCLSKEIADDLRNGEMLRRVRRVLQE